MIEHRNRTWLNLEKINERVKHEKANRFIDILKLYPELYNYLVKKYRYFSILLVNDYYFMEITRDEAIEVIEKLLYYYHMESYRSIDGKFELLYHIAREKRESERCEYATMTNDFKQPHTIPRDLSQFW